MSDDCKHGLLSQTCAYCCVSLCKPLVIRVDGGTKKGQKSKPLVFKGQAAVQEIIVFKTVTRVVEQVRVIAQTKKVYVVKEVTKFDYTPRREAILAEHAKRPHLSTRELAKVFGMGKSQIWRILKQVK